MTVVASDIQHSHKETAMNHARAGRRQATVLAGRTISAVAGRPRVKPCRPKRRFALTALMVPLLAAGALIGLGSGAASAGTCVSWTGAQPPSAGTSGLLQGATVVSSCSAWAAGYYDNGTANQTLIYHWNGASWAQQTSPDPGGTGETNELSGVTSTSTKNAWAVGYYYDGTSDVTLIEHWNGSNWTQQPSVNPGTSVNFLEAVKATSASNAWAVGYYYNGTTYRSLIERWNGSSWKKVASPNVGSSYNLLYSVAATSASNAWAVGYYYNGTGYSTLIEHWNGSTWKHVTSPNPAGATKENFLRGVAVTSAGSAWAVGYTYNGINEQTMILRWNGSTWKHVTSPNPSTSENILLGVKATSASNAWAVGYYYNGSNDQALVTHWNGHSWAKVTSPDLNNSYNYLAAVGASSATSIWAVGQYYNGSEYQGLAEHCC